MTEKVIVIRTDSTVEVREIEVKRDMILDGLREIVGGFIEVVRPRGLADAGPDYRMIVNEEGLCEGLAFNPIASALYGYHEHGHPIVGNVAIVKEGWRNGEPDIIGLAGHDFGELTDYLIDFAVSRGLFIRFAPNKKRAAGAPTPTAKTE